MKAIARWTLLLVGLALMGLAALGAFSPLNHRSQNAKNQLLLADMKARVAAAKSFQVENGRLPSEQELRAISESLPVRYHRYDYRIDTAPGHQLPDPRDWPKQGGWCMSFWRGEWTEYYSSWDDRYTLSDQLTVWDDGWIQFGFAAAVCLVASRLPFLRRRPNQSLQTNALDHT